VGGSVPASPEIDGLVSAGWGITHRAPFLGLTSLFEVYLSAPPNWARPNSAEIRNGRWTNEPQTYNLPVATW
jgi:hypothetical protein